MLRELDISALKEISVLLKISNSTSSLTPEKPQPVEPSKTPLASSPTLDQKILEISVSKESMPAPPMAVVLDLVPQDLADPCIFLYSFLTYFLINIPRNYSLSC